MVVVTNVTSFGRSGLSDFVVQRVTAVILAIYTLCILSFFLANPDLDHARLVGFFSNTAIQLFSTLALLSTVAHAWIGMWTVGTDYIRPLGFGSWATSLRFVYQAVVVFVLFVYVVWGANTFWSF